MQSCSIKCNRKTRRKTAVQQNHYTLLTVLSHLIEKTGLDRKTIVLVFKNIKASVSEHWDGIGEDDEQWRH